MKMRNEIVIYTDKNLVLLTPYQSHRIFHWAIFNIIERLWTPVRQDFHMGCGMFLLWFIEVSMLHLVWKCLLYRNLQLQPIISQFWFTSNGDWITDVDHGKQKLDKQDQPLTAHCIIQWRGVSNIFLFKISESTFPKYKCCIYKYKHIKDTVFYPWRNTHLASKLCE